MGRAPKIAPPPNLMVHGARAMAECEGTSVEEEEENREQQATELETLLSIFHEEITIVKDEAEFIVKVEPKLDSEVELVLLPSEIPSLRHLTNTPPLSCSPSSTTEDSLLPERVPRTTSVTHLPPLSLFVRYHTTYPSRTPPTLHLSARWLDSKLLHFAMERMKEMFSAECPIVFDWINYLQDEFLLEYIEQQKTQGEGGEGERGEGERGEEEGGRKMKLEQFGGESVPGSLDSSDETSTHSSSDTQLPNCPAGDESTIAHSPTVTSPTHCDNSSTAPQPALLSPPSAARHPCQVLLRSTSQFNDVEAFDQYERHKEFLRTKHECSICFLLISGEQFCEPCPDCDQAFCSECLLGYCQTRIGEGQVSHLNCPTPSCSQPLSDPLLEGLLSPSLFQRYLHLRDEVELDSIPGMVFCPRSMCGSRVVSEPDSNLAVCHECGFPFCKLCKQTWHGPGPCPALSKVAALQKAEEEKAAAGDKTKVKKKDAAEELRKLEELKTLVWMRSSENVKPCPKCGATIQKTGGCNKMTCRKCSSYFCWLCGKQIAGYSHFSPDSCQLFRAQDYRPLKEKKVFIPNDQEAMQNALMSECPRCQHTETKTNNKNWIFCGRCQFQYCHLCREPCYGLWHFSEYGCKQLTTVQQDMRYFSERAREQHKQLYATGEDV